MFNFTFKQPEYRPHKDYKLAYVAGPYRGFKLQNIWKAWQTGYNTCMNFGYYPVIPHCSSAFMDKAQSDGYWLGATLELMTRCDVVVMIRGWEKSEGARQEHFLAKQNNMEIIYD